MSLTYDDSGILTEGDLEMWHCNGTHGIEVTFSQDPTNNIMVGQDTELSWWLLEDPPEGGGGGAAGVPVFPNIYVGMAAAVGAGIVAYFVRKRLINQHR